MFKRAKKLVEALEAKNVSLTKDLEAYDRDYLRLKKENKDLRKRLGVDKECCGGKVKCVTKKKAVKSKAVASGKGKAVSGVKTASKSVKKKG